MIVERIVAVASTRRIISHATSVVVMVGGSGASRPKVGANRTRRKVESKLSQGRLNGLSSSITRRIEQPASR